MDKKLLAQSIKTVPETYLYLNREARSLAAKGFQNYKQLRADFFARVYDLIDEYLNGHKPVTAYRNGMENLVADYHQQAAEFGWESVGQTLPLSKEAQNKVDERTKQEIEFVIILFLLLRKKDDFDDFEEEAYNRAMGYSCGLDATFLIGKLSGLSEKGDEELTWRLGATSEHCKDCSWLDGQTHPASWYLSEGYIPRQPGSPTLECKGYNCLCSLFASDGTEVTIY